MSIACVAVAAAVFQFLPPSHPSTGPAEDGTTSGSSHNDRPSGGSGSPDSGLGINRRWCLESYEQRHCERSLAWRVWSSSSSDVFTVEDNGTIHMHYDGKT